MNWTITEIASVVLSAMGFGVLLSSLGHSPILGYIIAGVLLGPSCLQLISDREHVAVFSEMGILFLMFVIGLSLSLEKVKNMWKRSMLVTLISTLFVYMVMFVVGYFLKMPPSGVLLMTFCVALSSTAVTVKSLNKLKACNDDGTHQGTYGILISQDIAAIAMVLIVNFIGTSPQRESGTHKIIALAIFMIILVGVFLKFNAFVNKLTIFIKKHGDMLTMLVFGACLGSAVISEIFGLSASLGAFIAGLILGNSNMSEEIKRIAEPIEELLLMTFFLSVGLLVDLRFIWENFAFILWGILFVTVGKTVLNIFALRLCRFSMKESFVIGVLLAHIGEFSFMLVGAATKVGIVNEYGMKFLVSLTAISLFFSSFWLVFAERCRDIAENVTLGSSWEFLQFALSRERSKAENVFQKFAHSLSGLKTVLHEKTRHLIEKYKK